MIENFEVKEFTRVTWSDFDALFAKHKGVSGGCWCTFNLVTSSQFNKMTRDERKDMQHQLADGGQSCGLMIYDAGVPVGWVSMVQRRISSDWNVCALIRSWQSHLN